MPSPANRCDRGILAIGALAALMTDGIEEGPPTELLPLNRRERAAIGGRATNGELLKRIKGFLDGEHDSGEV